MTKPIAVREIIFSNFFSRDRRHFGKFKYGLKVTNPISPPKGHRVFDNFQQREEK